ncbi:GNAT family N-acetyltransferase [Longispora albida]|uniref:GNAT family N-acetyltransferase n=1 Tax=Longispora albida TaxID=203523 RepID=UPI0003669874|nr:GNAT family N-acetyltransferase [Longispora albida]
MTDLEVRESVDEELLPQLMALYAGEWWSSKRPVEQVRALLAGSDRILALLDQGELVAFCRAITDGVILAVVLDVIVAPSRRGAGLGDHLIRELLNLMPEVRNFELVCRPDLVPFYARHGFAAPPGGSQVLRFSRT